ncbi:hypothetical protein F2Q69_00025106 [Brassica cretica]|uniref:Uncharacterized protein n=1 Tax=Brassica cretica TaxID=69181 RepID=A0A8S9QES8_BRACR|nr:hypothetical protein F2Q69_00025106 [Brassica cretica]
MRQNPTIPSTHGLQQYREDTPVHGDSIVAVLSWRTLSSQIVRATIPGGPIGIISMSMTARPGQSVHDTSFMAT